MTVTSALVQASGKMVLVDKLLTKLWESGHKVGRAGLHALLVRRVDIRWEGLGCMHCWGHKVGGAVLHTLFVESAEIQRWVGLCCIPCFMPYRVYIVKILCRSVTKPYNLLMFEGLQSVCISHLHIQLL